MRYEAYENIPYGWEIMDTGAIPPRTFVESLTKAQAIAITHELNQRDAELVKTLNSVLVACRYALALAEGKA